jgi:hypothetical protein
MASSDAERYGPWLRLRVRHGALEDGAAVGRHLEVRPSPACEALLRRFALLLVPERDGVTLLAKPRWQAELAAWLAATGGGPLRLRLRARSPLIWGATAVPLAARASQWHLHGRWPPAPGVDPAALDLTLRPLAPPLLRLACPPRAGTLVLADERGATLLERPLTAAERGGGQLVQDLQGLPEGLVRPRFDVGATPDPRLLLAPDAEAVGLACLWLEPPQPDTPPLELSWTLPARSTVWHYLLVTGRRGERLEGLTISGDGCGFQGAGQPETLPDGRLAWRLTGDRPLPLAERSPWRHQLRGQRIDATGQSHPLRLDPLPSAPLGPVWPEMAAGPEPSGSGTSGSGTAGDGASGDRAAGDGLVGVSEMVVLV